MMMFQTLARTMSDPGDTLKIVCDACGRRTSWPRAQAFERLGPNATPRDARRRLRCAACGERRKVRVWI